MDIAKQESTPGLRADSESMATIRSDLVENIDNACSPWKPYNSKSPAIDSRAALRYSADKFSISGLETEMGMYTN